MKTALNSLPPMSPSLPVIATELVGCDDTLALALEIAETALALAERTGTSPRKVVELRQSLYRLRASF